MWFGLLYLSRGQIQLPGPPAPPPFFFLFFFCFATSHDLSPFFWGGGEGQNFT